MDLGPLFSTFGLVFLAELGDKTQLAVVAQTCRCRRPWAVFAGASVALAAATALGVAGGQVLGHVVPASLLRLGAAFGFVVMGLLMAREAWKNRTEEIAVVCRTTRGTRPPGGTGRRFSPPLDFSSSPSWGIRPS